MSLTRNNFHHPSTRVANESPMEEAPQGLRTSSTYPQIATTTSTSTGRSSSLARVGEGSRSDHYQHFNHPHHGDSENHHGVRSSPSHSSSSQSNLITSSTVRTNHQYHSVFDDDNLFLQQCDQKEKSYHQVPFQYDGEEIHSQRAHSESLPQKGRIDSYHRSKGHHHSMYPPRHQFHHDARGDPHSPWNHPTRNTPSPTSHSIVTNVDTSSLHSSGASSGNATNHTYRDFSGVPPSREDLERQKNKSNEYIRRLEQKKEDETAPRSSKDDNSILLADTKESLTKKRKRGKKRGKKGVDSFVGFMGTNFPARLHDLLSHENGINDAITWLPHGRSWIVRDKTKFLEKVAPSHFQISKFESFTRQVNGWGFKRITQGPDINSYYHELFLKGMPHLIQWMKRLPSLKRGAGKKKPRIDPKDEPDFYEIGAMYPIPDYYGQNGGVPTPEVYQSYDFHTNHTSGSQIDLTAERAHHFVDNSYVSQQKNGDWGYPVEGQVDSYPRPLKTPKSDFSDHNQGMQHDKSTNDFWNQMPYKPTPYHPDKKYYQNPDDAKDNYTGPSKNHWQSFCDALSQSEDEENQRGSNYQDNGDALFSHTVESVDFEPHNLDEFNPLVDSRQNENDGQNHKGWYSRHTASCSDHYYCAGDVAPSNFRDYQTDSSEAFIYPQRKGDSDMFDHKHPGERERNSPPRNIYPEPYRETNS